MLHCKCVLTIVFHVFSILINTPLLFCLVYRMKAYSLPPLYRFTKQNGNVRTARIMWTLTLI